MIFSRSLDCFIQFPALVNQSTNSVIRSVVHAQLRCFLEDTQQGYLSSVAGSDFELAAIHLYLSLGQSHLELNVTAEHPSLHLTDYLYDLFLLLKFLHLN